MGSIINEEAIDARREDSTEPVEHVPILLIGAGPTGLMLANLLGSQEASALLIERNLSTGQEPRAVSIDDESLRTTQSIGLSDTVLQSIVPGYGSDYLTPGGRCFLTVEPRGKPFGFPRRNAFRQPLLEAQLQKGTDRYSTVTTSYGWSLTKFEQDRTGVTAWLNDKEGGVRVVRSQYLVGCDGAGSTVRRQLGVKLEGETFAERWLIVDLADSPAQQRNTVVYCNSQRPCIALPGPDLTRRFEFKLHADERDEDMLRGEVVQELLNAHGAHPGSTLIRKVVYTFHARVAGRWSDRRVFLAGDAAHLTPPFAGQGMNSGIRDSSNLAWKLAFVTRARLSSAILATYEMERRNHVSQMITLALRMGRIMGPRSRLHGFVTQHCLLAIGFWPAAKRFFAEMKYKPKPRFRSGFMLADGLSTRKTLVGRMLLQPEVTLADGRTVLLDDCLGNGFALLGIGIAASDLRRVSSEPAIARLSLHSVVITDRTDSEQPVSGDKSVEIAFIARYPAEFEPYRGRILLVRPDRYVVTSGFVDGPRSIAAAANKLHSLWAATAVQEVSTA
jgi:3-(3-hydroxy-phenyl)propionate hydroxylase